MGGSLPPSTLFPWKRRTRALAPRCRTRDEPACGTHTGSPFSHTLAATFAFWTRAHLHCLVRGPRESWGQSREETRPRPRAGLALHSSPASVCRRTLSQVRKLRQRGAKKPAQEPGTQTPIFFLHPQPGRSVPAPRSPKGLDERLGTRVSPGSDGSRPLPLHFRRHAPNPSFLRARWADGTTCS